MRVKARERSDCARARGRSSRPAAHISKIDRLSAFPSVEVQAWHACKQASHNTDRLQAYACRGPPAFNTATGTVPCRRRGSSASDPHSRPRNSRNCATNYVSKSLSPVRIGTGVFLLMTPPFVALGWA